VNCSFLVPLEELLNFLNLFVRKGTVELDASLHVHEEATRPIIIDTTVLTLQPKLIDHQFYARINHYNYLLHSPGKSRDGGMTSERLQAEGNADIALGSQESTKQVTLVAITKRRKRIGFRIE
jgi:hypothetical protein